MTDLKVLIKKLSASSRTSLEQSANLCVNHQNFEIEIEHFFVKLLEQQSNDLELLLNKYKISKYIFFSLSGYTDWFNSLSDEDVLLLTLDSLYR